MAGGKGTPSHLEAGINLRRDQIVSGDKRVLPCRRLYLSVTRIEMNGD